MDPKDRHTVTYKKDDGWEHRTTYDTSTNNRWSVDVKDTGLGGIGSNWVEVKEAHHTNQNDNTHIFLIEIYLQLL